MPFGTDCEYADMDACIKANAGKADPDAYCAVLMRETEEACAARSVRMLRTKVYRADDTKVLDESQGRISAVVSSEKMDRDGDVIRVEGWDMANFNHHPVLLANHDYHSLRSQIGVWEKMEINDKVMTGVARFFIGKGNAEADWAFQLAKEKALAFSVGFIPDMGKAVPLHKDDSFGTQGMEFKGQELLEVSAVTVPSNPDALQRFAKSPNLQPVLREIAEERLTEEEEEDAADEETKDDAASLSQMLIDAVAERVLVLIDERNGDSPDEDEPSEDDEDDDEPENREAPVNEDEFDLYAEAAAAAEAALEEAE
jgi:hypothetical protein